MEKNERLELLRDIFTLIHPELVTRTSSQGKEYHKKRKQRVQTWLKDILQATSHEENPWRNRDKGRGRTLSLLPRFMLLLRDCILEHHWAQVLAMLRCISHIPYGADWATWKATLAAFYTEPESNLTFIQDFFRHSYLLKECNLWDVALEFVQYLITQGRTEEASEVLKDARRARPGVKNEYQKHLTQYAMNLLDGYQGLVFYMDWKAALNKPAESSQRSVSESYYSITSSQGPSEDVVKSIAKRATLGLDALVQKSGVWDIFLTKSVEIHEYYGEFAEARDLLHTYRDKNPDNPNSHRLMYEHLSRSSEHYDEAFVSEEGLSCLKSLAKLDPASPLVLTLWQKLTDGGCSYEALWYMFNLLDYKLWQEKAEGWQCLAKSLGAGFSRERSQEEKHAFLTILESCWSCRKDWWPDYHFTESTVTNADRPFSEELLTSKVIAAAVLIGKDCCFVTEAREALNTSSRQHLDDVLGDLDWDAVAELAAQQGTPETSTADAPPGQSGRPSAASAALPGNRCAVPPLPSSSSRRTGQEKSDGDSLSDSDTSSLDASELSGSTPPVLSPPRTRQREARKSDSAQKAGTPPVLSPPRTRQRAARKSDSAQKAGTPCPGSGGLGTRPPTGGAAGGGAGVLQGSVSLPGGVVAPDGERFSDGASSAALSSSWNWSSGVDLSSSDLSSSEAEKCGSKRCKTAGDAHRLRPRRKTRIRAGAGRSTLKNEGKSEVSGAAVVKTSESAADTSWQRRKRKRKAEDTGAGGVKPVKRRRTAN